jgi:hypothetical protein
MVVICLDEIGPCKNTHQTVTSTTTIGCEACYYTILKFPLINVRLYPRGISLS